MKWHRFRSIYALKMKCKYYGTPSSYMSAALRFRNNFETSRLEIWKVSLNE